MVVVDSYSEDNMNTTRPCNTYHPSTVGLYRASAKLQTFKPVGNYTLTSMKIMISNQGGASGELTARLYSTTGTLGIDAIPVTELAVSDARDLSEFDWVVELEEFEFSGDQQYELQDGVTYAIGVFNPAENGSEITDTKYVKVGVDTTTPTHEGNLTHHYYGAWTAVSSMDAPFYVYGDVIVAGGGASRQYMVMTIP